MKKVALLLTLMLLVWTADAGRRESKERSNNQDTDMYQNSERIGSLAFPRKFKDQDFNLLRDLCLSQGVLFEDDTFPAHLSSIGNRLLQGVSRSNLLQLTWKRPSEIHSNPSLIVDGASIFDIKQGRKIADCWVLAALGSLTLQRRFLKNVIPQDQGFKHKYAGIFHFRLWYYGDWVDVVIDDRLPWLNGDFFSVSPHTQNEFWPSLLEKAYAKLRGSYQSLHWGHISEALVDFTGGVQKMFDLQKPPDNLHEIMKAAVLSKCLMGCTTPGGQSGGNSVQRNGLVEGHAYTVTDAIEIPYKYRKVHLIRIWNPWGRQEWEGDWSDGSDKWNYVPEQYKKVLYTKNDDGEFWMSFQDFKVNFSHLCICNDVPSFLDFGDQSNTIWSMRVVFNQWNQGGSIYQTAAHSRNPEYSIQVEEPDLKDYNVVVTLMQKPGNNISNMKPLPIGFQIIGDGTSPQKTTLIEMRDITRYFHLPPGSYTIIPETSLEGNDSEFVLRIFQKSQTNIRQSNAKFTSNEPKDIPKWNRDNLYKSIFLKYANQSPYLDASQLQRILNEVVLEDLMASLGSRDGFSFDSCRSLLALMDINANGRLTLQEFERLWIHLMKYKDIFRREDEYNSGFLDFSNFRRIIQMTDLDLSDNLLRLMAVRYGDSLSRFYFPDFVCCMIRLETMTKAFHNMSAGGTKISFDENQWITMIMYC